MKRALERNERGEAHVIPIILRPVYWQIAGLDKLQALPTDAKPVRSWIDQDEAFFNVAEGIRQVIRSWKSRDESGADSNAVHQEEEEVSLEEQKQPSSAIAPEIALQKEVLRAADQESRSDKLSLSDDLDALYRAGALAQSQGDLERAIFLWQQILSENENFSEGMLSLQVQKLQKRLPSFRVERLRKQAKEERKAGLVQQEVSTLKA